MSVWHSTLCIHMLPLAFLVMMKLVPMAKLELTASPRPIHLSRVKLLYPTGKSARPPAALEGATCRESLIALAGYCETLAPDACDESSSSESRASATADMAGRANRLRRAGERCNEVMLVML